MDSGRRETARRIAAVAAAHASPLALGGCDQRIGPESPEADTLPRIGSVAPALPTGSFPLGIDERHRHLVDSHGRPFLLCADTAWSLAVATTREAASRYLDDRRERGFNAVIFNAIESAFSRNPPRNAHGDSPFLTDSDFTTPNDAYFAYVASLVRECLDRDMLALVVPAYHGYGGGTQGWYATFARNGTRRLNWYGTYLETRLKACPNVLYVQGGDYSPPSLDYGNAIATGIARVSPERLQTAHCRRRDSAMDVWGAYANSWLRVNTTYTGADVTPSARRDYQRVPPIPFFLIESAYEMEYPPGNLDGRRFGAFDARSVAWQAMLAGACGWVYGHRDVWGFGYGIDQRQPWATALASAGATQQHYLKTLLLDLAWSGLVPDLDKVLLRDGPPDAIAGSAIDRSYAIVWIPSPGAVTVDLVALAGSRIACNWYDPTDGARHKAGDLPGGVRHVFSWPGPNAAGDHDWALVLQSSQDPPEGQVHTYMELVHSRGATRYNS